MTNVIQLTEIVRAWTDVFSTRTMHVWTRYVKATGLSMPQFGILMHLYYRHTSGVSDIGEHMQISAAAASQLVDKLVQSGLLERIEDTNDRRARVLSLSPKGRALIESGIGERSRWVDEVVADLTPEEYEVVAAAMLSLTRAASRLDVSAKNFEK
jgi:DNA-binding MarR family transcriptional regulator